MKRLAKSLIGFGVSYLLRLLYNKVIKRLRHEPNQIDIIWFGELVKRLGNSPYSDCRQETRNFSSSLL